MGELVYCSTPRRMLPLADKILNDSAARGETPLFPFNFIPDHASQHLKKVYKVRQCYRAVSICNKLALYGISDGTLDEVRFARITGKPLEPRYRTFDHDADEKKLEAVLSDRSRLFELEPLDAVENGLRMPKLVYCATPTRMREMWKQVMEDVVAEGDCPLYPFNAIIEEHASKLSREKLMEFDFRLVSICDAVAVYGISEGTLEECVLARHLGKLIDFFHKSFDSEWQQDYEAVVRRRPELRVLG